MMKLSESVLTFKLLDASEISHRVRQLVLTGVDYFQKESLFTQMKTSLRKFHREQSVSTGASAEEKAVQISLSNLNMAVKS